MDARDEFAGLRGELALACRVLAARGLAEGVLGHVSLRVDDGQMLIRCRGPRERGLAWTEPADIRLVTFDGSPALPGELDGWAPPNELPLHAEILRAQPSVSAVVHAHPVPVVAADLAGIGVRPIVGAFDIPGARLAAGGVPVYPRAVLIRSTRLAQEMVEAMAGRPAVLLRGHGIACAGDSMAQAVLRAVSVNTIATIALAVRSAGGQLTDLPEADLAELPDLGSQFTERTAWRAELARLDPPGALHEQEQFS